MAAKASPFEWHVHTDEASYWGILRTTMKISSVGWMMPSLMPFGSKEQKRKYISLVTSGEPHGIWHATYSKPNAGSDFANIQICALRDGDEHILNGQKIWTICTHRACWCWIIVRTNIRNSANIIKKTKFTIIWMSGWLALINLKLIYWYSVRRNDGRY